MRTLFQDVLIDREFGRTAVRTADLRKWAADHAATIPPTIPAIDDFDVLHLESLLCAIERGVPALSARVASNLAAELPSASLNRRIAALSVEAVPQWMVGADVHQQWRHRIAQAIATGELRPVDVLSGLPAEPASRPIDAAPLVASGKRWTPERLAELRAHRDKHGTKMTAKWANISTSRVRELLPGDKPPVRGYSAFNQSKK